MGKVGATMGRLPWPGRRARADMAQIREVTLHLQHVVESMNHTVVQLAGTVERLDHDVRNGADDSLPLFLGYADRLRTDTDTSIAVAQAIEREVAGLRAMV